MAERVDLASRLAGRIVVDPSTGCHVWQGYRDRDGYGQVKVDGVKINAHRVSYALHNGELIPGFHIDHLCRNRSCINPNHLEQVTPEENTRRGLTTSLTADTVAIIKTRLCDGDRRADLAADFGVHKSTIQRIAVGAAWADVPAMHESLVT